MFGQVACDKVNDLIKFGFNIRNEFTLPPNIPINTPFNLPAIPMDYNAEEAFKDNGTRADLVKEITLEYIKLNITEPIGQDFTFVKDIELIFSKDGMDDMLVAWIYDVPDNVGQELTLDVVSQNLDAYLKDDGCKIKLKVTTDKLTTKEIKISSDIRIRVTANIFK